MLIAIPVVVYLRLKGSCHGRHPRLLHRPAAGIVAATTSVATIDTAAMVAVAMAVATVVLVAVVLVAVVRWRAQLLLGRPLRIISASGSKS